LVKVPASDGIKYSDEKRRVLDLVPPGGCWRNLPKDVAKKFMKGSYYLGGGKTGVARRLSWNEPSLTLTCSPCQGQTERCHPDETRPLTIREYARIQNFPDNWIFQGSVYSQYKQIGNAVPINFAKQIGLSIIKFLEKNK
jgi:DNA (cytosine-5)-methyltransferase 1